MNKNILVIGIVFLFIVSSITPMVFGYKVETTKEDEYLEKLAFACSDRYGSSKLAYYKELLQRDYSNIDVVESEEIKMPVESSVASMVVGPMNSPWPMQSHDTHHTGRSSYSTVDTWDDICYFLSICYAIWLA